MDDLQKKWNVGPGGVKCACCGPPPGKKKDKERRLAKKRLKQEDSKFIKEELKDMEVNPVSNTFKDAKKCGGSKKPVKKAK